MKREEKIEQFLNGLDCQIDILNYVEAENVNSFDDISEQLEDVGAFDQEGEIIYYARAMEFLTANDTSLNRSMEIAAEMGLSTEYLNSEVLASLLNSQMIREEFYELEDEINDFFEEL